MSLRTTGEQRAESIADYNEAQRRIINNTYTLNRGAGRAVYCQRCVLVSARPAIAGRSASTTCSWPFLRQGQADWHPLIPASVKMEHLIVSCWKPC